MNKEAKIVGQSQQIKKLLEFVKKAAITDANVLLLGETGVGKELAARIIHSYGKRKDKPFIKINCANLNENLLESELFGHKRGAYTGAITDKPGLIEEANGGTFFLDEIADITPHLQAKFLSVIEDKELRRLGENKTKKIDIRFILATNKDLFKSVMRGTFRKDLYYRISILTFYIPPLKERKEDIPLLIKSSLKKESLRQSKNFIISQEAIDKLMKYPFPGNVRELENILERAVIFAKNSIIKEEEITFQQIKKRDEAVHKSRFPMEKIVDTLIKHQGNKTNAAKELGISRVHFYRILNNIGK